MSTPLPPFRVIVVGAGVAGLTSSHAFQKAGIHHVVLEKRSSIAPPEGASLAMYPHGARILHQLGCLSAIKKHSTTPGRWLSRLPTGKMIADKGIFRVLEENHGSGFHIIERKQFLQELYDALPDKTHIKTACTIEDIRQDANGVEVILSNGDVEKGDLVLGCDGVYSSVRDFMWDHADKTTPGLITREEKLSMQADWKCLVVMTPAIPELGNSDITVVHNNDYSHLFTMTPSAGYFYVFFRLEESSTFPSRPRYTDQDAEDLAKGIASHPLSGTVVFGDVWKRRIRAYVVNLEEGVLSHWFHDRIALVGDSVHKVTPNISLGGNSALESVAVLTNHLRRMLMDGKGVKPTPEELQHALAAYQTERLARMKHIMDISGHFTRVQAWHSWLDKLKATWLVPALPDRPFTHRLSAIICEAPKLDFISASDFPSGRMPWKDQDN